MDALTYEYLLMFYEVLNAVSDYVFKRKCLMEKQHFILKG